MTADNLLQIRSIKMTIHANTVDVLPPSKHESLKNKKQQTKSTIRTSVKDGLDLRQKDEGGTSPVSATVETNTSSDPPKLNNEEKSRDADVDSQSTKLLKTRPWENSRLGWIANPQRPTGKFYNSIMPDFYRSFWPFYPDEKTFRSSFITERKRQWDMLQNIETLIKSKIRNLQNVSNQASQLQSASKRITFQGKMIPTKVSSFYFGSVWDFHNCNRVPFEI